MAGTLTALTEEPVPRWGGVFERTDGSGWWVEVWDFSSAPSEDAPEGPILSYVMLW